MPQPAETALIAVGANATSPAGGPEITVPAGIEAVAAEGWRVLAVSRFYRTPCFPPGVGDDYVNAAFAVRAEGRPEDLLACLHAVEARFGRARRQRWGSRSLDLDLVAWGDRIAPDRAVLERWMEMPPEAQKSAVPDALILPHPRVQDRAFVLVPLADVAPGWVHPALGLSVAEMLAARPGAERAEIVPLD